MLDNDELKKTILRLRKAKTPMVVVETSEAIVTEILEAKVLNICNEIGLQVICERDETSLKIRNLFFSNN